MLFSVKDIIILYRHYILCYHYCMIGINIRDINICFYGNYK